MYVLNRAARLLRLFAEWLGNGGLDTLIKVVAAPVIFACVVILAVAITHPPAAESEPPVGGDDL